MLKANGAKEQLNTAHDAVEAAWARFCEANGASIKAKAQFELAGENYLSARKRWLETVERCTPGEVEDTKKKG